MSLPSNPESAKVLEGKPVLVACSRMKLPMLVAGLEKMGARAIAFPTIEIREAADKAPLDAALDSLERYSWIIFTSAYAVSFFSLRMRERGLPRERLLRSRICAVGPATSDALKQEGIPVLLVPRDFSAEGILEALRISEGRPDSLIDERILLPRALEAREILPRELAAAGARVDDVPCYENVLPQVDEGTLRSVALSAPCLFVFTSPSTVTNFVRLFGQERSGMLLAGGVTAALGPSTAKALQSVGAAPEITPEANTIPSLLEAISRHFSSRPHGK